MIYYILLALIAFLMCAGPKEAQTAVPQEKGTYMHIKVKEYGEIIIKMNKDEAPNNVANIVKLANEGFYDGLTFHRIISGFVIQGGCPRGDGTGSPGYRIDDEISPKLKHLKGTVAMANSGPNTNGCQFYICLGDLPQLDRGGYSVFGQVVRGIDVVDKIAGVNRDPRDNPLRPVIMEQVYEK